MKRVEEIDSEIDEQIAILESKGIKPELLLIGDMSYYNLKVSHPELVVKVSNVGLFLKEYKGLRVIIKPSFEAGGVFKQECESIEVFGK